MPAPFTSKANKTMHHLDISWKALAFASACPLLCTAVLREVERGGVGWWLEWVACCWRWGDCVGISQHKQLGLRPWNLFWWAVHGTVSHFHFPYNAGPGLGERQALTCCCGLLCSGPWLVSLPEKGGQKDWSFLLPAAAAAAAAAQL